MFAANGGKKAGEFYTPHEVSLLMSEIIAEHHKDKKSLKIYDPTCGSGSLLINNGIARKSKADYAFLLHDLYHLNNGGIMTIVLPHGVYEVASHKLNTEFNYEKIFKDDETFAQDIFL